MVISAIDSITFRSRMIGLQYRHKRGPTFSPSQLHHYVLATGFCPMQETMSFGIPCPLWVNQLVWRNGQESFNDAFKIHDGTWFSFFEARRRRRRCRHLLLLSLSLSLSLTAFELVSAAAVSVSSSLRATSTFAVSSLPSSSSSSSAPMSA